MGVRIRQRSDKPGWWLFIDHQGKQKKKHFPDKETALRVARKVRERLALGDFSITEKQEVRLPFSIYYQTWLESYVSTHTKASTFAAYETAYRVHLLPFLGEADIREITREQLKRFIYEKLNAGLAHNSIKGYLAPLSEMFNHAIEDGHLERNPCVRILRTPRKEKGEQQNKMDFLTREELTVLLETCQKYFPVHYPFILLLARTGLRIGEAVALQWSALDFHSRFIEVKLNWVDGKLTTPKNSRRRRVDMSKRLAETLTTLHLERKKQTLREGWNEVPPWVFISQVGTMLNPDNFRRRVWAKLLERAGLRHIRIHDLRHTFASLLIQQGESLAYVKEQMGHYSIRVTVDTYGHLVPGGNKAAVDRLDEPISASRVAAGPGLTPG